MMGKWESKRYESAKATSALMAFVNSRKSEFSFACLMQENQSPRHVQGEESNKPPHHNQRDSKGPRQGKN